MAELAELAELDNIVYFQANKHISLVNLHFDKMNFTVHNST